MVETIENYEYSKEWLVKEIIKTYFKEKKTKEVEVVRIKKLDLLKLVLEFQKLNESRY